MRIIIKAFIVKNTLTYLIVVIQKYYLSYIIKINIILGVYYNVYYTTKLCSEYGILRKRRTKFLSMLQEIAENIMF